MLEFKGVDIITSAFTHDLWSQNYRTWQEDSKSSIVHERRHLGVKRQLIRHVVYPHTTETQRVGSKVADVQV